MIGFTSGENGGVASGNLMTSLALERPQYDRGPTGCAVLTDLTIEEGDDFIG